MSYPQLPSEICMCVCKNETMSYPQLPPQSWERPWTPQTWSRVERRALKFPRQRLNRQQTVKTRGQGRRERDEEEEEQEDGEKEEK